MFQFLKLEMFELRVFGSRVQSESRKLKLGHFESRKNEPEVTLPKCEKALGTTEYDIPFSHFRNGVEDPGTDTSSVRWENSRPTR